MTGSPGDARPRPSLADDAAAAFAGWIAAAPRTWLVGAVVVAAAAALLETPSAPIAAVLCGAVAGGALARFRGGAGAHVPTAAVGFVAALSLLPFVSPHEDDLPVVVAARLLPAAAGFAAAAWSVGRERSARVAVVWPVLVGAVVAIAALRATRSIDADDAHARLAVTACAALAVFRCRTADGWCAAGAAAAVCVVAAFDAPLELVGGVLHGAGLAVAIPLLGRAGAAAARPDVAGRAEESAARVAVALRRRPLATVLVASTAVLVADPSMVTVTEAASAALAATTSWEHAGVLDGAGLLPLLAAMHVATLDGLARGLARISIAATGSVLTLGLVALEAATSAAPSFGAGWAWILVTSAAVFCVALLALTTVARVGARAPQGRRPGRYGRTIAVLAVLLSAAPMGLVDPGWTYALFGVVVLLWSVAFQSLPSWRTPATRLVAAALVLAAVAGCLRGACLAALRLEGAQPVLHGSLLAAMLAAELLRAVGWVLVVRRLRGLTPVPETHPIVADFGVGLRTAPSAR